ncbi:MAG: hypothetical protein M1812_007164 [Candelaria pacifica]|nr:MAG: hypothetical protein M1812_007164 [Candelaria pacifica]
MVAMVDRALDGGVALQRYCESSDEREDDDVMGTPLPHVDGHPELLPPVTVALNVQSFQQPHGTMTSVDDGVGVRLVVVVLEIRVVLRETVLVGAKEVDDAGLIEDVLLLLVVLRIEVGLTDVTAGFGIASEREENRTVRKRAIVSFCFILKEAFGGS